MPRQDAMRYRCVLCDKLCLENQVTIIEKYKSLSFFMRLAVCLECYEHLPGDASDADPAVEARDTLFRLHLAQRFWDILMDI